MIHLQTLLIFAKLLGEIVSTDKFHIFYTSLNISPRRLNAALPNIFIEIRYPDRNVQLF